MILLQAVAVAAMVVVAAAGQSIMGGPREDLFSATSKLGELLGLEAQMVRLVDRYVAAAQHRADTIRRYVAEYGMGGGTQAAVVSHPVDAFLLLKRLTVEWEGVEAALTLHVNATQELLRGVEALREGTNFPAMEDLHGAAVALVRLQDIYQLDMTYLPEGTISVTDPDHTQHEYQSQRSLSARDCLFLGKHAFNSGYYDKAIDWFRAALDRANHTHDTSAPKEEITTFLQSAIKVHDDVLEKRGPRGVDWQTRPVPLDPRLATNPKYRAAQGGAAFVPKLFQHQSEEEEQEHFTRLCRGEKLRPAEMESQLVCRLVAPRPGFLTVQPLQLEEASRDPYIVVLHNFLTHAQTDAIIAKAKPKLATSRHRAPDGGFVSSMIRTSKNAWLRESTDDDQLLTNVTRKIEATTHLHALPASAGEDYQVANYGIGGLYVTHTDHLLTNPDPAAYSDIEKFMGDRFVTLMVYLTDVEAGGATVFPRAGVTLWPQKGSAALWWNLYKSGVGDENTKHGGCPVLHGSKWICNKWIHYNDQFLRHKCGQDTWEKVAYP